MLNCLNTDPNNERQTSHFSVCLKRILNSPLKSVNNPL